MCEGHVTKALMGLINRSLYRSGKVNAEDVDCDPPVPVEQHCYLTYPSREDYNEFPRPCPVHGTLSKPKVDKTASCMATCLAKCKATSPANTYLLDNGLPKVLDSVADYLNYVHKNGFAYPKPRKPNPGSAYESYDKSFKALGFSAFQTRPKSPLCNETHSFRARRVGEFQESKGSGNIKCRVQPHAYRYCRDLGLSEELSRLFLAQLRHTCPQDYVQRPAKVRITVYFQNDSLNALTLKAFPNEKYFVHSIRHSGFANRPDLHFADQILEVLPAWVQNKVEGKEEPNESDSNPNCFFLVVVPSPYYRTVHLRVHDCPIVEEQLLMRKKRSRRRKIQSASDIGFTISNGKILHVERYSPAMMSGMEVDNHIIEVAGESVLQFTDEHIVRLIRGAIQKSANRSVVIAMIPSRIYDALMDPRRGQLCYLDAGSEFNVNSWSENKIFAVRMLKGEGDEQEVEGSYRDEMGGALP